MVAAVPMDTLANNGKHNRLSRGSGSGSSGGSGGDGDDSHDGPRESGLSP